MNYKSTVLILLVLCGIFIFHNINQNLSIRELQAVNNGFQIKLNEHEKKIKYLEIIINEISKVSVKATAYNAIPEQTDNDPDITACMDVPTIGSMAVSQDLYFKGWTCGKRVHIKELGIFTIKDVMHKRKRKQIDILMETKSEALRFGIKKNLNAILLNNYEEM